jgi:TRAP-type C4-dicarboxylate transport system permease small subunit
VIFEFVSPRVKALLYLFGDLVMLGVACFALYWSWESVAVSLKFGSVSHGLRVPMAWFLSAVPIGFLLLLYRLQQSIRRDLSDLRHGRPVFEGERLFD